MLKTIRLNYGCGENKLPDCINIDKEKSVKPDLVCDLRHENLPYNDNVVDIVYCFHCMEHIEYQYHLNVYSEFYRVLKPKGVLVLAYPEFFKCVSKFKSSNGNKDFFRATLYGRQLYPGDYHVTPMVSVDVKNSLESSGFTDIKYTSEPKPNEFYTVLKCYRSLAIGREHVLRQEIFG